MPGSLCDGFPCVSSRHFRVIPDLGMNAFCLAWVISNDGDWSWHIPMLIVGWYYWRESEHTPGSDWFHHRLLPIPTSYHLPDSSCFCLFWQMCLFGPRGNFAWPQTFLQFYRKPYTHTSIGDFTLPKGGHFTELWKSFFWIGTSLLSGSFSYVKNQNGIILLYSPRYLSLIAG
jgi:hypothetical protein